MGETYNSGKFQKLISGVKVISLLICHKYIFVVNMPDKSVTLNDILVGVFCKSGENLWYLQCNATTKLQWN